MILDSVAEVSEDKTVYHTFISEKDMVDYIYSEGEDDTYGYLSIICSNTVLL